MINGRFQKLMTWLVAIVSAFSLSVMTGACVFETDDDADTVPVETEEEEGAEVETEVEVEDEETP